jgi:hypothetical protein
MTTKALNHSSNITPFSWSASGRAWTHRRGRAGHAISNKMVCGLLLAGLVLSTAPPAHLQAQSDDPCLPEEPTLVPIETETTDQSMCIFNRPQGLDPWWWAIDHSNPELRRQALILLARLGTEEARANLRRALRSPHPDVRSLAATLLGALNDPASVGELRNSLNNDPLESVRVAAVRALGRMGAKRAVPDLIDTLRSASPPVAAEAAISLGAINTPESRTALKKHPLNQMAWQHIFTFRLHSLWM